MTPSIIERQGFIWLTLPRSSVKPLSILIKEKESFFKRVKTSLFGGLKSAEIVYGDIFSIFPYNNSGLTPKISEAKEVVSFNGFDIIDLGADTKINLDSNFPSSGSATISLAKATKLLYTFDKVKRYEVNTEVLLEEYINLTAPVKSAPGFLEKLNNGEIYVVTEVLTAKSFSIQNASDFIFDSELNLENIAKYVDYKSKFNFGNESKYEISGAEDDFTFAIKICKIIYHPKEPMKYSLSKSKIKPVKGDNLLEFDVPVIPSRFLSLD